MKKYNSGLILLVFLMFLLSACKRDILDKAPVDRYTDAVLWLDINLAQGYLLNTYEGAGIGYSQYMITSVSDESQSQTNDLYVRGDLTPENTAPWNTDLPAWNFHYQNIQKVNKLLGNINRVVDAALPGDKANLQAQVDVMKGEALFLRAFAYTQLVRTYGGVPLLKVESEIKQDFQSIPRASFEETVSFIIKDCDDAATLLLTKDKMQMGRTTKEAAMALKSRISLFAASDLTADGTATSKFVGYQGKDRTALWTVAKNAAKAIIDLGTYKLEDFGAPNKAQVPQKLYSFFTAKDLSSPEVIWGKMYSNLDGAVNQMNQWDEPSGKTGWNTICPTQKLVDTYQMEDGSGFFNHFQVDASGFYKNISGKYTNKNIYASRDPRFYGTILYDSAIWKNSPYSIRDRIIIQNGVQIKKTFGYDTRNSDYNAFNATQTGYAIRKMLDEQVSPTVNNRNQNIWIELRYAEILLNYAEACIALGQTAEAAIYIKKVRDRAAMPDFTGDITQALRYERQIELAFENHRWYDMRRYKVLLQNLTDSYGINIIETSTDGNISTTWQRTLTQKRNPAQRNYWIPISRTEVSKAPKLDQNPGY